jgi:hypothetical protein
LLFGENAAQLCTAAIHVLGWRPDEFWWATPAELALALARPDDKQLPDAETIVKLRQLFPDEEV